MNNIDLDSLRLLKQKNEDAYTKIVEEYQRPVYNLCYRMLGREEDAEDAAQETFWRAFQNIDKYDPQRSFITWLLSIAAHYCIDQQRRRHLSIVELDAIPEAEEMLPDDAPSPERISGQKEQDKELHLMLKNLPSQDRAAIILRYWYEFSEQEISDTLSLSVSAVKSRLFRARQQLAQMIVQQKKPHKLGGIRNESPAF